MHNDNTIKFCENDIVNNQQGDYQVSIKKREKLQTQIMALDILMEILYEKMQDTVSMGSSRRESNISDISNNI